MNVDHFKISFLHLAGPRSSSGSYLYSLLSDKHLSDKPHYSLQRSKEPKQLQSDDIRRGLYKRTGTTRVAWLLWKETELLESPRTFKLGFSRTIKLINNMGCREKTLYFQTKLGLTTKGLEEYSVLNCWESWRLLISVQRSTPKFRGFEVFHSGTVTHVKRLNKVE